MECHQIELTKGTPYLALTGKLWGVFCEDLAENGLNYNGTTPYVCTQVYSSVFSGSHWLIYSHPLGSIMYWGNQVVVKLDHDIICDPNEYESVNSLVIHKVLSLPKLWVIPKMQHSTFRSFIYSTNIDKCMLNCQIPLNLKWLNMHTVILFSWTQTVLI